MANTEIKNLSNDNAVSTSIAPWLSIGGRGKAVDFYKSAFGAVEVYCMEDPGGGLVAKLSIDRAEFWLSEEPSEHAGISDASPAVRMILTVTNPDALFAQALAAGATQVFPVSEEHGWRLGRLVDPFGHHWEIGRPLKT